MERIQNVILFSAGESVHQVNFIKEQLAPHGIRCFGWRELFTTAHDSSRIALLPNLVKKIPSFDFAVILAEGVDQLTLRGQTGFRAMRDNVIFELGLCIMGLGPERVILLAEESVRIPEDLMGVGTPGVRYLTYRREEGLPVETLSQEILSRQALPPLAQIDAIVRHIEANAQTVSPVFVGAAVSSAEAYFQNFILRLLENLGKPILLEGVPVSPREIRLQIYFPAPEALATVRQQLPGFYEKMGAQAFVIPDAGSRALCFRGTLVDGVLTVLDVPTSVTASYSLVGAILSIDADADRDETEQLRFMTKEMDVYRYTLGALCTPELARKRLRNLPLLKQDAVLRLLENVALLPMPVDKPR